MKSKISGSWKPVLHRVKTNIGWIKPFRTWLKVDGVWRDVYRGILNTVYNGTVTLETWEAGSGDTTYTATGMNPTHGSLSQPLTLNGKNIRYIVTGDKALAGVDKYRWIEMSIYADSIDFELGDMSINGLVGVVTHRGISGSGYVLLRWRFATNLPLTGKWVIKT